MDALGRKTCGTSAYGQAVWSCLRDAGVKLRENDSRSDGGKKARFTGESTEQPFQPLRRECRDVAATCSDYARMLFSILHTRLRVRLSARHSLRPLFSGGTRMTHHPDASAPRECCLMS